MRQLYYLLLAFFLLNGMQVPGQSTSLAAGEPAYQDLSHQSRVFGHPKYYRLYLPSGYAGSAKRYPVIYFFHGWGGRHFMDDNAQLEYIALKKLVDRHQVILVMWDGNIDLSEPRPYNVGNHEDVKFRVQMKDYFPELVGYIDSSFRTIADRRHRGLIGFSMGGFMSLYLGGKYPDSVCSIVSFAGSPEFFVGEPENHTLYPVRYAFKNLREVDARIYNGDSDILTDLNEEVHAGALWEGGTNLSYRRFRGGHMIDKRGETIVFEEAIRFLLASFSKKDKPFSNWTHEDLYPAFGIRGYRVTSDKKEPGYISLHNVGKSGFGVSTKRWLPDGPPLDSLSIGIVTAPVYAPGEMYTLVGQTAAGPGKSIPPTTAISIKADDSGRLSFLSGGSVEEFGISQPSSGPAFVFLNRWASHKTGGWENTLTIGKDNRLFIQLFNRGGERGLPKTIRVKLMTDDSAVQIDQMPVEIKIRQGQRVVQLPPLAITCSRQPPPHAEPPLVKFRLAIDAGSQSFKDEFIMPVLFNAPDFDSISIDDGKAIRDSSFGTGNGNSVAEAGERILVYAGSHRLRLLTDDPYVIKADERLVSEIIPARWPDGYTMSSVIRVSGDCPNGHVVECLGSYETKSFNPIERSLHWGRVRILVSRR